ncbi:MAG: glycoside hydrolase family 70 protein [Streptococcus salivarius]
MASDFFANDVDLSNPVVQAEQLNQIHYLMNWGSIVMGDKDANFDGIRVDAVDNVDADMLQLCTNYFRENMVLINLRRKLLSHLSS